MSTRCTIKLWSMFSIAFSSLNWACTSLILLYLIGIRLILLFSFLFCWCALIDFITFKCRINRFFIITWTTLSISLISKLFESRHRRFGRSACAEYFRWFFDVLSTFWLALFILQFVTPLLTIQLPLLLSYFWRTTATSLLATIHIRRSTCCRVPRFLTNWSIIAVKIIKISTFTYRNPIVTVLSIILIITVTSFTCRPLFLIPFFLVLIALFLVILFYLILWYINCSNSGLC